MKILFLGEIGIGQTSRMRMRAFERLGHEVEGVNTVAPWKRASWLQRQVQRRLQFGSIPRSINRAVLDKARLFHPDLIWAEKQEYLKLETVDELRRLGARLVHFTPDPYFFLKWKRTRLMDQAIGAFDVLVYCKSYERRDFEALRKPLIYMPLGYCDEVHRPLPSGDAKWSCAVGFVGGWELRREQFLHSIAAANMDLKIWGKYWDFLRDGRWSPRRHIVMRQLAGDAKERVRIHRDEPIGRAWQGDEVYDDDYARALTGAKIGLGFLRVVCPDQHTTRTFEIPACGSMLLADRTDEHREFFEEGKEADFFGPEDEFLDKVKFYSSHESTRARLAEAGYRRCIDGRYAYIHRLKTALNCVFGLL
jgi:spore maturation protein CgeB